MAGESEPDVGPVMELLRAEIQTLLRLPKAKALRRPLYQFIHTPADLPPRRYANLINRMVGYGSILPEQPHDVEKQLPWSGSYWHRLLQIANHFMGTTTSSKVEYFRSIQASYRTLLDSAEDVCLSTLKTQGTYSMGTTALLLYLAAHANSLGLPNFLFAAVYNLARAKDNVAMLLHVFFQSKMYFLLTGKYLPIVVYYTMAYPRPKQNKNPNDPCFHSVAVVYLPDQRGPSSVWYRIFIDTSAASYDSCAVPFQAYAAWEADVLRRYNHVFNELQYDDVDLQIMQIFCIGDIQGEYSTCSHWSSVLSLVFVYNYEYLLRKLHNDPLYVTKWFNGASAHADRHMETFLKAFLRLRQVFYKRFLDVMYCLKIEFRKRSAADRFLRGVVWGVHFGDKGFYQKISFCSKHWVDEPARVKAFHQEVKRVLAPVLDEMEDLLRLRQTARRQP